MSNRVQGFPTIKAWVNGKAAGEYSGDRSASAIKDWALGLLPNRVATVNKQTQARPTLWGFEMLMNVRMMDRAAVNTATS